jgi:parvulin-like peptidyl-prolyl isomerase
MTETALGVQDYGARRLSHCSVRNTNDKAEEADRYSQRPASSNSVGLTGFEPATP